MADTISPPASVSPEYFIGSMFVTATLAIMLYGITTTQSYIYWLNFPDDLKITRRTVLLVWIIETFQTVCCLHLLYHYVIIDFGDLPKVMKTIWSGGASVMADVSISAVVQVFFVRRIWILSKKSFYITVIPAIFLVMRVCMSYPAAIMIFVYDSWATFDTSIGPRVTVTSGLSLAVLTDLCIAISMLYYLQQNRTGVNRTDNIVRRLQSYVINTGAVSIVASLTILLTFVLLAENLVFIDPTNIASVYANSFLGMLNARSRLPGSVLRSTDPASKFSTDMRAIRPSSSDASLELRHIEVFQQVTSNTEDEQAAPPHRMGNILNDCGAKNRTLV